MRGELLEGPEQLDAGAVVLMLDLPADKVSWLAVDPTAEWIGSELRLGKRPFAWCYRPAAWPAWNCHDRRLARLWSADHGTHNEVIDMLRQRRMHELTIVEPSDTELGEQLVVELAASRRYLNTTLDNYRDPAWRRAHKGGDDSPEDALWRAAQAVREIEDALASIGP